jgi:hypothetical protein
MRERWLFPATAQRVCWLRQPRASMTALRCRLNSARAVGDLAVPVDRVDLAGDREDHLLMVVLVAHLLRQTAGRVDPAEDRPVADLAGQEDLGRRRSR